MSMVLAIQTVIALGAVVQCFLFVRWLYRRIRADEINRAFIADMATNHLPHIYEAQRKICRALEIELEPAPPIRWLDMSARDKDAV